MDHRISLRAPGNLDIWCQQLETLIRNPRLRVATGARARDIARRRFGLENMAKATVQVYEDVVCSYEAHMNGTRI
jgi:glycosyltransferase involved in cell wall biosynthesis